MYVVHYIVIGIAWIFLGVIFSKIVLKKYEKMIELGFWFHEAGIGIMLGFIIFAWPIGVLEIIDCNKRILENLEGKSRDQKE